MIPKFSQLEHLQRNSKEILLKLQQKEKEKNVWFVSCMHWLKSSWMDAFKKSFIKNLKESFIVWSVI